MNKYFQNFDTVDFSLLAIAALVVIGIVMLMNSRKRAAKYAGNSALLVILVVAIVVGLNWFGVKHAKRWDTTGSQRFSLALQTVQILKRLDKDVEIKAFFPGGDDYRLKELLVEYQTASRRIHYEFINPNRNPSLAAQNGVTKYGVIKNPFTGSEIKYGTVIVSYGNRQEKIEKQSEGVLEEDITNAIIKAERSEVKKIYFIKGHGEKDPSSREQFGFMGAKQALDRAGYMTDMLDLASAGKLPADAKVLIEAGPTVEMLPQEIKLLDDFLAKGNVGMLVLLDPKEASLEPLTSAWGIQVNDDIVLAYGDDGRLTEDSSLLIVDSDCYQKHKITENFNLTTIIPVARSVLPAKTIPGGIRVDTLFRSKAKSLSETNLKNPSRSFAAAKGAKGPLSLAVAATKEILSPGDKNPAAKTRMVVVGSSLFAQNYFWGLASSNRNLFMNMVAWLAQDEDLISIMPKSPVDRRILLTPRNLILICVGIFLLLPGIACAAGITVYISRRRK
jgi:ABC-type uncharacterized transport system involved in gliding motility auxiliary subunit